jgi:DeoR/GlpR family transcriptional regulator of sugar metabolism
MFPADRRRQIAHYVNEHGSTSITELSAMFNVSEMTIHRDLKTLDQTGLLRKTRGGALAPEPYLVLADYQSRLKSYEKEKEAIGCRALEFIQNGDTILLGPGTTCLSIARQCYGFNDLTVITNGPLIILELAKIPGITVHSTGGLLSKTVMAYVGPVAEKYLSTIRPDKCFIGANGITLEDGITDPLPFEASIKRKMVEVAQEVYLVATPDKFGHVSQHVSFPLEAVDVIIMHKDTPDEYCQGLESKAIRCVFAE